MVTEAEALDKSHADLARRLADAGRKIKSDAKVIAALREALKPFADAVYNDNGDMTISHVNGTEPYVRAYFAFKKSNEQTVGESK